MSSETQLVKAARALVDGLADFEDEGLKAEDDLKAARLALIAHFKELERAAELRVIEAMKTMETKGEHYFDFSIDEPVYVEVDTKSTRAAFELSSPESALEFMRDRGWLK